MNDPPKELAGTSVIRTSCSKLDLHASAQSKKRKCNEPGKRNNDVKEVPKWTWPPSDSSSFHLIKITKKHVVYCVASDSSEDILVKVIKSESPAAKDLKNLNNELEVGKIIMHHSLHPSLRCSYERTMCQNKQAMLLEWAKGHPISEIDFIKTHNIEFFLEVAREIVSALLAMHMKKIIHMNITCDHILIDPETKLLKLIGYGSSVSNMGKNSYFSNEELLDKDLRYVSPEQTGRVNREVDFRSDFYSLGIVFYRLLTGEYPFESNDAMKLIHMHILQDPLPVNIINPRIPDALSDMVSILLKKNAEERYLSAKGIIHDLDFMISEYPSDEKLTSVLLKQHDTPENLFLRQKLYGRCDQYESLVSAFDRVTFTSSEVIFVAGESGTGKSSMVLELYKSIAQRDGIFICGKLHHSTSEPYGGLKAAINSFCDDILLRDKDTIEKYKNQIQDSVGDEGIILTNFITNLNSLIDPQPNISDSFGQDAKNRFVYVFVKFMKAICLVGPPIVLVLEDLHWLDLDSSNLLSSLLTDQSNKNFMFVGTYRQNEASNITDRLLKDIKEVNTNVTLVKLDNMDHECMNDLISDALCVSSLETYSLTAFLYEKTNGNLFFLNQMLKSLSEQGSIFFCNNTNGWKWDASIFNDNDFSETAIELVIKKIHSLDNDTKNALKVASCLGHSFSLENLKYLVKNEKCIEDVIYTGMIIQQKGSNSIYRFAHDQIQQAALLLISKNAKEIYWCVCQKLLSSFSQTELDDNIFVLARLLCHSCSIISDEDERFNCALLLLRAGKKAIHSTAFAKSFRYLKMATQLIGKDFWTTHYDLTLEAHNVTAKSAFCISDYTTMNVIIDEISKNATSKLHLIQSCSLQIKQYKNKRMFEEAISSAINILDYLGENININPEPLAIQSDILKARNLVQKLTDEEVLEYKVLEHEVLLSIMVILSDIIYCSFLVNKKLFSLVSARMTILSIQHGLSKFSAYGLCAFGVALCGNGDKMGYRCGKLALVILEKMQEKESTPFVHGLFYAIIGPFYSSIHNAIKPLKKMYKTGFEIGSLESVTLGASTYAIYALLSGTNLATLLDDIESFRSTIPIPSKILLCVNQAVLGFHDLDKINSAIIEGELFDYQICYDKNEKGYDISRCLVICIFTACIFNDYNLALHLVKMGIPMSKFISFFFMEPIFLFYDGLVSLVAGRFEEEREKQILIQHAKENITKLRKMSEDAPENYLNKVYLLEAELAVAYNDKSKAILKFKIAVELSIKYSFLHEEAIIRERAAMYYMQIGSVEEARLEMMQSFKCYKKWGAIAKLKNLIQKFPTIFKEKENCSDGFDAIALNIEVENNSLASISMLSASSYGKGSDCK